MNHEFFMRRCIQLANYGLGQTYPNPLVGAVIVHQNKIIGEGWHQKAGESHAEVRAVAAVKDKSLLKESTIYVSLEPCNHFGKTPPCCDLILENNIPNIVVGCVDSFEKVAGSGILRLQKEGKNVTVGILENEAKDLNKRFFTYHQKKRPYIILKWAESQDGFIAPSHQNLGQPFWLTELPAQRLVHKWRTEEQAIIVGTKTALLDNPRLNVRHWHGNAPLRICIDLNKKLTPNLHLLDGSQRTLIYVSENQKNSIKNVKYKSIQNKENILNEILDDLYQRGIQSLIVEGGTQLLNSFIHAQLWDEARVFVSPKILIDGIQAPCIKQHSSKKESISNDTLNYYFK
jgi:diaminohydroxyphosphoribosylaminopyrimidine deaminase / 5-amino-6-(5-phosphoribosylamino)uracil reductase